MLISYEAHCYIDEALTPGELELRDNYIKNKEMFTAPDSGGYDASKHPDRLPPGISGHYSEQMADFFIQGGGFLISNMKESDYFFSSYDVTVVPHARYTPHFLHEHGFIEMVYVLAGTCTNYIQNKRVPMIPGDICIIAPGTKHTIEAFSDECMVLNYLIRTSTFEEAFFSILSSSSILSDFFRHIFYSDKGNSYLQFSTGDDGEIRYFLARIYEESKNKERYKNEMMNAMLTMFFLMLIRRHEDDVILPPEDGEEVQHPVTIFRYMQENYKTVTLGSMSEFFHYSERHMKRIIKKYTGHSFSETILGLRMSEARQLLLRTKLPVAEIAAEVGYGDTSSFRYAFKKYYGAAPRAYREENAP